jgi:hypothetical protein
MSLFNIPKLSQPEIFPKEPGVLTFKHGDEGWAELTGAPISGNIDVLT